jgi:hypothetical protein
VAQIPIAFLHPNRIYIKIIKNVTIPSLTLLNIRKIKYYLSLLTDTPQSKSMTFSTKKVSKKHPKISTHTSNERKTRIPLLPSIIVRGVTEFVSIRSDLIDLVGKDNFAFKSTVNNLKIISSNPSVYRAIVHYLKDNKAEYNTY